MTSLAIAVLGATAGFTIFLGLPLGRLRTVSIEVRASLNAVATGVLVFLLWDVLAHASDPVEAALTATTVNGTAAGGVSAASPPLSPQASRSG